MATIQLPPDFKEFLQLLNAHNVKYLLIGGYAVGYHGYPRATIDMDIWVAIHPQNAEKIVTVLEEFGFNLPELNADIFLKKDKIIRMGILPMRLEILTTISGVEFEACYQNRIEDDLDGVKISLIGLDDLKRNVTTKVRRTFSSVLGKINTYLSASHLQRLSSYNETNYPVVAIKT